MKGECCERQRGPGSGLEREREREAVGCRLLGQGPGNRASGTDRTMTGFSH